MCKTVGKGRGRGGGKGIAHSTRVARMEALYYYTVVHTQKAVYKVLK